MNTKEKELRKLETPLGKRVYRELIKFNVDSGWWLADLAIIVHDFTEKEIRTAVANTEKQVMEKYNSIGRVVEKSSKLQLDKWEAAIRKEAVAEREKEIKAGISQLIKSHPELKTIITSILYEHDLKGETKKTEVNLSYCNKKDKRSCCE